MIRMVDIQVGGDLLLVLVYEASSLRSTFIIRDHIVFKLVNLSLLEQDDEEAFDVLYCIAFAMMDAQWLVMRDSDGEDFEKRMKGGDVYRIGAGYVFYLRNTSKGQRRYVGIYSSGFRDFLLKPELLRAIVDSGFEHPSEGKFLITPIFPLTSLLLQIC
ncbi:hypothetical protein RHMOL_Rhmol10G0125500 [Rhododendron molle]|uniref:Uncharacterized protein n=1 Tax=Rhododendron molle TaxID=49168 RepID=A0ACC0M1E2_RHOML|nr:hypothetical protein RHMOL_Rhmol10G0125500 [Rhododendron molle]